MDASERSNPYTARGKSSGCWIAQMRSCSVFARRQHLRRVPNGNPSNGNGCTRCDMCLEMNHRVDPKRAALSEVSGMKHGGACGDEHLVFDVAADQMGVWPWPGIQHLVHGFKGPRR